MRGRGPRKPSAIWVSPCYNHRYARDKNVERQAPQSPVVSMSLDMRVTKKTNVERLLDAAGVAYVPHTFDGRGGRVDAAEIATQLGVPPARVFKTLVTETSRHEAFVFVVPADGALDLKKAARAADVRALAMLPQARLFPLTGYVHGGCSPLGMRRRLPTFIDVSAKDQERIFVSAGHIGMNVEVGPNALANLIPAAFADLRR